MWSFAANEVHTTKPGHSRADADGAPVTDIITEGMHQLVHEADGPIVKFNRAFAWLQKHHRVMPVSMQWEEFKSSLDREGTSHKPESQATPSTDNSPGRDEGKGQDENMAESETYHSGSESGTEEQDEQNGSESGVDKSESEESEGEEFWEEAFNLEFELGEGVFNVLGDTNVSDFRIRRAQ
ncbi:hypothetical protein FRC11_008898 [Ceratobasidium sp. 423]|nr:hypothetical protein FRC11_008898 [Ceratobasidium sp. 423]